MLPCCTSQIATPFLIVGSPNRTPNTAQSMARYEESWKNMFHLKSEQKTNHQRRSMPGSGTGYLAGSGWRNWNWETCGLTWQSILQHKSFCSGAFKTCSEKFGLKIFQDAFRGLWKYTLDLWKNKWFYSNQQENNRISLYKLYYTIRKAGFLSGKVVRVL